MKTHIILSKGRAKRRIMVKCTDTQILGYLFIKHILQACKSSTHSPSTPPKAKLPMP